MLTPRNKQTGHAHTNIMGDRIPEAMGNTSSQDPEAPALDNEADTTSVDAECPTDSDKRDGNDTSDEAVNSMEVDLHVARAETDKPENIDSTVKSLKSDEVGNNTSPIVSNAHEKPVVQVAHSDMPSPVPMITSDSSGCDVELESCGSTPFTFEIVLHCESVTSSKAEVEFKNPPKTVLDVKRLIQDEFKVPVCCQKIFLDSTLLQENERLKFYRIRNGDTLHVYYNSEADVEDIYDVITSMENMVDFIQSIQPILNCRICTPTIDRKITENVQSFKVESLAVKYFYPCCMERAKANRLLFVQSGGLELLYKLHEALLKQPWQNIPLEMQYLEHALLRVLWNFTAAFSVRTLILSRPTLSLLFKSFNRVKIPHKTLITAPSNNPFVPRTISPFEHDRIASEVIYKALGTICNLAELPECRVEVAANKEFLDQAIATIVTVAYKYIARQVALAGLLCLAYSPETHVYLCQPKVIEGIQEACVKRKSWYPATDEETRLDNLLLRYFGVMFFSQLVCSSSDKLSLAHKKLIHDFIQSFLNEANHEEIRQHEVKSGYIWSTLVPFAKLAFVPCHRRLGSVMILRQETVDDSSSKTENGELNLEILCIEAGVFSLQNILSGNEGRDILIEEGLLDYVMCLPWNIPEGSKAHERVKALISYLSDKIQLQPPSLVTMVKAKLAAMHFGLVKVIRTDSVHQLLAEVYQ